MSKHKYIHIECPDKDCQVWFQEGSIERLCKEQCKGGVKSYIECFNCGNKIYFELYTMFGLRFDCVCGACNFQRMSSKYKRIFKNEKI